MQEHDKLPDLIGDIYDAAVEPALWPDVVAKIIDFVGGRAGGIVSRDPVHRVAHLKHLCNIDPHYIQLYAQEYAKFDPFATVTPLGQVASIPDLVPYDDYRRGRYYQEWFRPQGWADAANVLLEKSASNHALILSIVPSNPSGMVENEMRCRIALVVPHARRALLIGNSIELKQSEAASFADTLNGLNAGIFFVEATGRIVHANAAAHDMLYANDFVRSVGGYLVTRDEQADETLREVFAAASRGDAGTGTKAIALPLTTHDSERYVAHVLPLTSGARCAIGTIYGAVAAVFVRKAELGTPLDLVAKTYKLTPAELRVLLSIVDVGGVPKTAAALGVAETTVKTHLYRLFDKAGVSRQADLVKIVAGFANPLVE